MHLYKKIISFILIAVCIGASILPVFALEASVPLTEQQLSIIAENLSEIESAKEIWNLSEIDFLSLRIGVPIQTYTCISNTLQPGEPLYPISYNGDLVMWAIPIGDQFQFSTALVEKINSLIGDSEAFALIYDRNNTYAYLADEMITLLEYKEPFTNRDILSSHEIVDPAQIDCVSLESNFAIPFGVQTRDYSYAVVCDVSHVEQTLDNTCWAASIACISNYLNNTEYTDICVAHIVLKGPDAEKADDEEEYDVALYRSEALSALAAVNVSYRSIDPSFLHVYHNIYRDYPVLAFLRGYGVGNHYCTIYGANTANGRLMITDPLYGFTYMSSQTDGYYLYTNPATLSEYELESCFGKYIPTT